MACIVAFLLMSVTKRSRLADRIAAGRVQRRQLPRIVLSYLCTRNWSTLMMYDRFDVYAVGPGHMLVLGLLLIFRSGGCFRRPDILGGGAY